MTTFNRSSQVLVVSRTPELAEITRKALGDRISVEYAANKAEARDKIRQLRPQVIILGYRELEEGVFNFYKELSEGWISRHSSIFAVELNTSEDQYRLLSDKDLESPASIPPIPLDSFLTRIKELILIILRERQNGLKQSILDPLDFCLTWEQIPGMGAFEARQEMVLENARKAAQGKKICAISIVDNPGGNPAISTEILCSEIRKLGIEPMVHLAFRDKSRNQVESLLYQLAALDINNLLILTGDYPSHSGFAGTSRPVFDLDSVNGLRLISEMNRGMEHSIMRKKTRLAPTDFFAGVAVSPFKQVEAEVMGQYYKLKKKIEAGADFAITQIGYDYRKLNELHLWLKTHNYDLPVLVSIQVLSLTAARAMNANRVPGCVVTDKLLSQITEEYKRADRGHQARLDRAAKMYAISRGMGFRGACISGQGVPYEDVDYIIEKGEELLPKWQELVSEFDYPQENGFYYFEKDTQTGLNRKTVAPRQQKATRPPIYWLSKAFHVVLFEPKTGILFRPMRQLAIFVDSHRTWGKVFGSGEFWTKAALYGCQNCGDCALYDVAYLCPISQCPKNQRNAPCGGSYHGWCEVYPNERKCIWVRAYQRLRASHKEDSIGEYIVPPNNWELWQTSSWLNYFLGRDHVSKRAGIKPPQNKAAKSNTTNLPSAE